MKWAGNSVGVGLGDQEVVGVVVGVEEGGAVSVGLAEGSGGCVGWRAINGVGGSVAITMGCVGSNANVGNGTSAGAQAASPTQIDVTIKLVLMGPCHDQRVGCMSIL